MGSQVLLTCGLSSNVPDPFCLGLHYKVVLLVSFDFSFLHDKEARSRRIPVRSAMKLESVVPPFSIHVRTLTSECGSETSAFEKRWWVHVRRETA